MPTDQRQPIASADAKTVLRGLLSAADNSISEEDLRIRCEPLFRDYFTKIGVRYEPRYEKIIASRGRIDALFGKVITEYKKVGKLRTQRGVNKAITQLQEYLEAEAHDVGDDVNRYAGVLIDGERIAFTRMRGGKWATDVISEPLNVANVKLLLEYYRSLVRRPLEPFGITRGLGSQSKIAKDTIIALLRGLDKPTGKTKLLFAEWRRMFGQVSGYETYQLPDFERTAALFGVKNDADGLATWLFATHTYFAIVIKLLAAEILTIYRGGLLESYVEKLAMLAGDDLRNQLHELEEGGVFRDFGIENFLEGDFFSWYLSQWSDDIEIQIHAIGLHLQEYEPATSILEPDKVRDLLKGLYQNLVPRILRHDLGEYYTPDWLAEHVLQGIGYDGDLSKRLLDPSSGSGTFVVLAIRAAKAFGESHGVSPLKILNSILTNIVGFDLNPLAVIAARTNYLLAIGDLLRQTEREKRVEIPIYLSDSIFSPKRNALGQSYEYFINTDKQRIDIQIPSKIVERGLVSDAMNVIEKCVINGWTEKQCRTRLMEELTGFDDAFWRANCESLLNIFRQIAKLEGWGWNRIWCRIIKNRYASASIGDFDYIAGNPAWVRWTRLPVSYRETVKHVCDEYDIFSTDKWVGGIESDISTVLTYAAVEKWLKGDGKGKLGFVITQSVFKSKSSEGFRHFAIPNGAPFCVDAVDDMVDIKPFENAQNRSAVMFLTKGKETTYPVPYSKWSKIESRLPPEESSLEQIQQATRRTQMEAFPVSVTNNAWITCLPEDTAVLKSLLGKSTYDGRKCVTSDLNNVFWVQLTGRSRGRLLEIENNLDARAVQVKPFCGVIEPDVLYPLVRGRDIEAFRWQPGDRHIIVPQNGMWGFSEDVMTKTYPEALNYFAKYKAKLTARSSYRRYQRPANAPYYSLWNVGSYTFSPYKVVWREIGLPIGAAVLSPVSDPVLGSRVAIPDHKLMMVPCQTAEEAHYLCGFVNSTQVKLLIESFVVNLQVGARIFENARIPTHDPSNSDHTELAKVSSDIHAGNRPLDNEAQREIDRMVRHLFG